MIMFMKSVKVPNVLLPFISVVTLWLLPYRLLVSGSEKEKVKSDTLELSLKYSFVTPLTSMVVTKPQAEDTDVLHKPKEGGGSQFDHYATPANSKYLLPCLLFYGSMTVRCIIIK